MISLGLMAPCAALAADLILRFEGLFGGGQVSVAVFDGKAAWDRRAAPRQTRMAAVAGPGAEISLSLPPGTYGVMAFHDRNLNGRLDTLPIGLPTEPYGFSRNARGRFGPPAWGAAAFAMPSGGARLQITLR